MESLGNKSARKNNLRTVVPLEQEATASFRFGESIRLVRSKYCGSGWLLNTMKTN